MSVNSVRPVCAESNPVHSDPGTSARDRFVVNSSTGLSFSPSPEWLWSRIMQGCFRTPTENKIRILAGNLSVLDQIYANHRAQVLREVLPKTDHGAQTIVNKPGHFMKLHGIEPSGLRMDDPWTPGKRNSVSWSDAYKQGYFCSYIVLTR